MFRRAVVAGMITLLTTAAASVGAAGAQQAYTVDGRDVYKIGTGTARSMTLYHGTEQLTIRREGATTRYVARVDYEKRGDEGKARQSASYTSTLLPSGEQRDGPSHDPDYLTVLNQPFSVQLDAPTMHDLARVKRPVPFDFPSPMTGATLRGTLRRLPDGSVNGIRCMGIAFEASGPLHGALPDRPGLALAGGITMKGTAYYAYDGALLLALQATLAIDGTIADPASTKSPVSIIYERSIRSAGGQEARLTPGPPPTPRRT
jgi:hypothetical protein